MAADCGVLTNNSQERKHSSEESKGELQKRGLTEVREGKKNERARERETEVQKWKKKDKNQKRRKPIKI